MLGRSWTVLAVPLLALTACGGPNPTQGTDPAMRAARDDSGGTGAGAHGTYVRRDLVSSGGVNAERTDSRMVNAWGLDALPASPWWVADNGTNVSTLFDAEGAPQPAASPLVVDVPGAGAGAAPTGLVANSTSSFGITMGGATGPALFLFAGEDGTVSAWMRTDPVQTTAVKVADGTADGAIFKGIALASTSDGERLYATDFHNAKVRVWDSAFHEVSLPEGAFHDGGIPAGFAPFGIRVIHDAVVVTYAKQDEDAEDDVKGAGLGFVDAYSPSGELLARIASRGKLNAPWGLALAPADFGPGAGAGRLLVGNFGDGHIIAFALPHGVHGKRQGEPGDDNGNHDGNDNGNHTGNDDNGSHDGNDDNGNQTGNDNGNGNNDVADSGTFLESAEGPIVIDGLWALSFGNGAVAGPKNVLFFTAGPNDEEDGLFGRIDPAQ